MRFHSMEDCRRCRHSKLDSVFPRIRSVVSHAFFGSFMHHTSKVNKVVVAAVTKLHCRRRSSKLPLKFLNLCFCVVSGPRTRFQTSAVTLRALRTWLDVAKKLWNFSVRFAQSKNETCPHLESKQKRCLATIMARQNLRNFLLLALVAFATLLSESPRQHVEARTLQKREVEVATTEAAVVTTEAAVPTTEAPQIPTVVPTTSETLAELTTDANANDSSPTSAELQRWIHWISPSFSERKICDVLDKKLGVTLMTVFMLMSHV